MNYCVYKHTCPNGKVYVGITSMNPIERWKNGFGYHHNQHFTNAILKYGWDNIKHEILYSDLSKEEACEKEIELIALYKSNNPDYGYNFSSGGESHAGCQLSIESRKKMSDSHKGKRLSEETRKKMSESRKGKRWKCSERARKNMSESKKGKPSNHPKIIVAGKTLYELSDETGVKYSTLYNRIFTYKWPLEKALKKG